MADKETPYIQTLLGNNIRDVRNRYGYSQQKLSEMCEVSTNYIGEIEIARKFPSAKVLQRIADALALKPYQLFFSHEEWRDFDKYNELVKLLYELKTTVDKDIEGIIKRHLSE